MTLACKLKKLGYLAIAAGLLIGLNHCGGSTSGGTTGGGGGSTTTTTTDDVATTSGVSTSLSTVSSSATTGATADVSALVKTAAVTRALVPRRVQTTIDIPTTTEYCDTSGAISFGGSMTIDAANDGSSGSLDGAFDLGFDACSETITVPASDGDCDIDVSMDGDMTDDFTGSYVLDLDTESLTSYDFTSVANTSTPLTITINDESHTVELMDYSFTASDTDPTGTISGTVTVDGEDVSASDVSSTDFTMAELCP